MTMSCVWFSRSVPHCLIWSANFFLTFLHSLNKLDVFPSYGLSLTPINFIFFLKMCVALTLPYPSGWPKVAEKKFPELLLIISYKMAKEFWKKSQIYFLRKNGRGPPTPVTVTQSYCELVKILKIFIDHKLQNGKGILKKFPNLVLNKDTI